MSEDKMRYEFEAWLFKGHDLPAQSISYTAEELLFKLWSDLKACAAIKDAEIEREKIYSSMQFDQINALKAEIAARDLMIKELRDEIQNNTDFLCILEEELFDRAMFQIDNNERILMKSEHHNSRALEKMLLEARIDELTPYDPEYTRKFQDYEAKLAELNKE